MGVAYIMTFSKIEWMRGYKVFECATKYMWVISQNALSLIIVAIEDNNRLWNFSAGVTYIPSLVSLGMFRQWKMITWDNKKKIIIKKTIGTSQVETCLAQMK